MERITFEEAIRRAVERNPSVARAAAGILRSQALLAQNRARVLPNADLSLTTTTIEPVPGFSGQSIVPRTQTNIGPALNVPLFVPVRWALQTQAADQVGVATRESADVRRQVASATADAFLAVIAARRQLELNERARDTARAHFDYATQRFEGGVGSRLNQLRAEQELSTDETRVEAARLLVRNAQEALGVLVAADGPIDAEGEPSFEIPPPGQPDAAITSVRPDILLAAAREAAADRVVRDTRREYFPVVGARVAPTILAPSGLFGEPRSLAAQVLVSVPLFDAGERRALTSERRALFDMARVDREEREREAHSEVRRAREAVRSTEQALTSARAAAAQAEEVVRITDVAFRAGATTNIEVIDAQRGARDSETLAAIAEDAVRRSRLDLLLALGRFP
jgi:outer membrane protein TolC